MNKLSATIFACVALSCIFTTPVSAGTKKLYSFPIESVGTMSRPWTVMVERDAIMATPSWNDPTVSEPPLAPETAIRIAEDFLRTKGFDRPVIGLRVTSCEVFSPDKWYYVVSFHPGRDNLPAQKGYGSIVILMNGVVLEPTQGLGTPIYKK